MKIGFSKKKLRINAQEAFEMINRLMRDALL
jgi:hypothetical protein